MVIQWLGQSCFKIQAKGEQGQTVTIVIDPYDASLGLTLPRLSADIVLSTHDHADHNHVEGISGDPLVVRDPGEYERKGVFIYGIAAFHDASGGKERGGNVLYHITAEGLTMVHCGDLGHLLNEQQLEIIEDAHILCLPVGGGTTLGVKEAVELVSQVEPRIVLPMHYALPGITMKLESVDRFCREMGVTEKERLPALRISAKDLPQEEVRTVLLTPA